MARLTKDAIVAAQDLAVEVVPVPEWGGEVGVKAMNGTQRDAYEISLVGDKKTGEVTFVNVRARLLAFTLVGEDGELLFSEAEIPALGLKSAKALDRVFEVAQRLNGIGQREIEALTKN